MLHARRAVVVLVSVVVGLAGVVPAFTAPVAAAAPVAPSATHRIGRARALTPSDASALPTSGYWLIASNGGVFSGGTAAFHGAPASLAQPIVGMAATPSGAGYWMVASDGGIFAFGDAAFHGSTGAIHLNQPIVGMAATPSGHGYWLVARDGGIFAFGDAAFHGSTGAMHLNQPIVGMAATPSGDGYWLVASDGGIFAFGDAVFHGSTGAMHLNQPIVGIGASPTGAGYRMVASDGGVFSFGDAPFEGSTGALHLAQPIVGMAATRSGAGYWFVARDGGVFSFGDAHYFGSVAGTGLTSVVGMAASNATASGPAAKLVFQTQPGDGTGGTDFASQPVVAVEDAQGRVVANDSSIVTLSLTGAGPSTPGATLTCDDRSVAAVNGIATFSGCAIDRARGYTLTASDGSLRSAVSSSVTVSVGPAAGLRFTTPPSGAVHDVAFGAQPVVSIVDAGGNVVVGNTSAVTLALTSAGGASLACTANPKTAVAGVATFAGCRIDTTGVYTLTASDGAFPHAISTTLRITGPATHVAFATEPSASAAGGAVFATQPVVQVEDVDGNTVVADASTVSLALTSAGGASLSCTTDPKVAVAGVAAFAGCMINHSGTYSLTATDGSLVGAVSTTIVVSVGAASKLAFTTQPVGANGGVPLATQPVVTVEDTGGNPITGSTASVTLAITTPGGASLSCTTNPKAAVAGVATFAGCRVDHANTYTFTASASGLAAAVSDPFTISVGPASQLGFTTQPAGATGGSAFTAQPVVAVQDAGGNTITGDTSSVRLALTTPGSATLRCTTNPKNAIAGVATFAGCNVDVAGTYTLTATDGSLTDAVSSSFTNAVGAASQLEFTTQPVGSAGGAAFATQPVVTVQDIGGNTVSANTSLVTLSLTSAGGATLGCTTNPKAAIAGVATFAGCNVDSAGTYTLTASDGLLSAAISGSITITPGTATQLAFTTEPGSGTGGVPFTTQPVVAIEDSLGNVVTSNVTTVALALTTPAGATLACNANPQTAAAGIATFAGCNVNRPGTYTLTASDGSLAHAVSTDVVITVGSAARVSFTTQPGDATAGDPFSTQPVVKIEDAGGNVVTSNTSAVTLALTSAGGATLTCDAIPLTAAAGVAAFTGCNVNFSGTFTFTATDGSLTADVSRSFLISPAAASQVEIVTAPGTGDGGSPFATQPEVAVEDTFGNIERDDSTSAVTLAITGSGGATLTCTANTETVVAGVASFSGCAIDHVGTWTVTASDGSLTPDSVSVVISVGDPARLIFTTEPSSATGGLPFATQPAVSLEDAGGNVVTTDNTSSVSLALTAPGGANLACDANPAIAASGVATYSGCAVDHTGSYTLTATDGGLTPAVSSSITISLGAAAQVAFTTQPSASTGGTALPTQPLVAVEDAGGNLVTTDNTSTVTLTITTPAGAHLACDANPATASSGVATFSGCAVDRTGPHYTLTATDGSLTTDISDPFAITVGPAVGLTFERQPGGGFAGADLAPQPIVAIVDAGGNVVTTDSSSVTLALAVAGGATLSCDANPLGAISGEANFATCQIDLPGTYTITASDGALAPVDSNAVTIAA